MPAITLRVRGPNGQATITLPDGASFAELQQQIAESTGVAVARQELLSGFPPTLLAPVVDGGQHEAAAVVRNGDSIVVRMSEAAAAAEPAAAAEQPAAPPATADRALYDDGLDEDEALARAIAASLDEQQPPPRAAAPPPPPNTTTTTTAAPITVSDAPQGGGCPTSSPIPDLFPTRHVVRRVVASDNSCLFSAVSYVMEGASPASRSGPSGRRDPSHASALRAVVARRVRADPDTYTEAFLGGESNEAYATWILDPKHWGGAVELDILSQHFRREIAAYCVQTKRCDVYGQDKGYKERAMVIYDGLHYDALAVAPAGSQAQGCEGKDQTIFEVVSGGGGGGGVDAEAAARGAEVLVAACNAARQFTDTANFTLRCGVCGIGLKGEKEAVVHAGKTGHQNFQEY